MFGQNGQTNGQAVALAGCWIEWWPNVRTDQNTVNGVRECGRQDGRTDRQTDGTFSAIFLMRSASAALNQFSLTCNAYRVWVFVTLPSKVMSSGVASTVLTRVYTRDTEQGAVMDIQTLSNVSVYRVFTSRYDLWFVFGMSFLMCHACWHWPRPCATCQVSVTVDQFHWADPSSRDHLSTS